MAVNPNRIHSTLWRPVRSPQSVSVGALSVGLACGLASTLGVAIAVGGPRVAFFTVLALGCFLIIALRVAEATAIVLLGGAAIDGLPGPSISGQTLAMVVLALVLAARATARPAPIQRPLLYSSLALAFVALVGLGRGWAFGGSLYDTLMGGVDLLLLSIWIPVYAVVLQDDRLRRQVIIGWSLLAAAVSVSYSGAALGLLPPDSSFVHAYRAVDSGGLTRVFAVSGHFPTVVLPFALAAALVASVRKQRLIGLALTVACASATVLSLGRVQFAGAALACIAVAALWSRGAHTFRRTLALACAVCAVWFVLGQLPATQPLTSSVNQRIGSIFQSSADRTMIDGVDTLEVRSRVMSAIRDDLSVTEWTIGKGLISREAYRYPVDTFGLLRNSDLGWYGGLTTLGLIGVLLVLFYPVWGIYSSLKRRGRAGREDWIVAGGFGFCVYALVSIQTLGLPFNPSGIVMSGAALGLLFAVCHKAPVTGAAHQAATAVDVRKPSVLPKVGITGPQKVSDGRQAQVSPHG